MASKFSPDALSSYIYIYGMVPDKRENVPLIRVKKLICQLCFFSTECKISNHTKLILVRAISDEVA